MIFKLALVISSLGMLFLRSPGHFDPDNLYTDIQSSQEVTSTPPLPQTFTYIGEGAQVYAFASENGELVLKLFKAEHNKTPKLSRILSHLKRSKADWQTSHNKWKWKFEETTRRYNLALRDLKEETGLVFLHFEKTEEPLLVTLIGKYTHQVDLAPLPFIVQKKAELAPAYFARLKEEGNLEKLTEAKKALKQFFVVRAQKGYSDPRQSLSVNYGFLGDRPIQIDVGKIEPFQGDLAEEMRPIHAKIDEWVKQFGDLL